MGVLNHNWKVLKKDGKKIVIRIIFVVYAVNPKCLFICPVYIILETSHKMDSRNMFWNSQKPELLGNRDMKQLGLMSVHVWLVWDDSYRLYHGWYDFH